MPSSSPGCTPTAWPARAAIETTAWPSIAAAATRSWTSAAATAVASSTPSPARPCTAPKRRPRELVLILRGFAQGVPTAQLARELECDRSELLDLRHRLQDLAFRNRDLMPLDDPVLEADETYQNAGEKGVPHLDPEDPPRRRANKARGHGTWENDRPPVCGVVGREERRDPADRHRADRRRDAGHGRAACQLADGDGQYR